MNKEQLNQLIELLVILSKEEWEEFSKDVKEMGSGGCYFHTLKDRVDKWEGLWTATDLLLRFLREKRGDHCNLDHTWENEKKP